DYQAKISGPLLDRIDIQVDVPPVSIADLAVDKGQAENSATVASRIAAARAVQRIRYGDYTEENPTGLNAHAPVALLESLIQLTGEAAALMQDAAERLKLSARGYHRMLRVGRTIADLEAAGGQDAPEKV